MTSDVVRRAGLQRKLACLGFTVFLVTIAFALTGASAQGWSFDSQVPERGGPECLDVGALPSVDATAAGYYCDRCGTCTHGGRWGKICRDQRGGVVCAPC